MPDYSALLNRPVDSVERPKPKAPGTYHGVIMKFEFGESQKKKTPYCRFTVGSVSPGMDVDPEENAKNNVDVSKWAPTFDFYLTDDSLYRLRELIEGCGIVPNGRGFNATIPELKGKPVKFVASHRPSEDGSTVYTNVDQLSGN